jgi:hypothetical protein
MQAPIMPELDVLYPLYERELAYWADQEVSWPATSTASAVTLSKLIKARKSGEAFSVAATRLLAVPPWLAESVWKDVKKTTRTVFDEVLLLMQANERVLSFNEALAKQLQRIPSSSANL